MGLIWSCSVRGPNGASLAPRDAAQKCQPSTDRSIDPYVDWAESTDWRGYRRLVGKLGTGGEPIETLRILACATTDAFDRFVAENQGAVAAVYRRPLPGMKKRYFTAELPRDRLDWLKGWNLDEIQWELALPFRDAETAARAVTIGLSGQTRDPESFRPPNAPESLFARVSPSGQPSEKPKSAIAVIDFGCPFLNPVFDVKGKPRNRTRLHALWDQGSQHRAGGPWGDAKADFGYGRVLYGPTMNELIARVRSEREGRAADESDAYRELDYLINYDDARHRIWDATHGSHVADVAAGAFDPLLGRDGDPKEDAAGSAAIVFVQLPALTGADCAGGSLGAQVLDALRFVLDVCSADARIVVNLSYGSFAGPHDGSSLIERAIDDLVKACGGRLVVVVGAGNSRQAQCHARRSIRKNCSALLRVGIEAGDYTDTFVEAWFSPRFKTLLPLVRVRVRTSDGDWSPALAFGERTTLTDPQDDRAVALLRLDQRVPSGEGALALLCIAPTSRPADDDAMLAPVGQWEIELFLDKTAPEGTEITFDAWVERDDPGWLGFGVQPRFLDQIAGDADETLSSLATGEFTIAVGGFRFSSLAEVGYSSIGTRKGPPVVYAMCEESDLYPSVRAAAVRDGNSLRMNGTSVAAPVFARRAYNQLMALEATSLPKDVGSFISQVIAAVVDAEPEKLGLVRYDSSIERSRAKN